MTRNAFVLVGILTACGTPDTQDTAAPEADPTLSGRVAHTITHGPVIGAVDEQGATVWVRLNGPGRAHVVVQTASGAFKTVVRTADRTNDFTLRWPIDGLDADTDYPFDVYVDGRYAASGDFRTAPETGQARDFQFVVFSDVTSKTAAPAYASALADDPAFALQIGDFDHRNPAEQHLGIKAWRQMHRDVLGDAPMGVDFAANILANMPLYHVWDDHDYGANNLDRRSPYKAMATRAYDEYFVTPERPNAKAGIWYSFQYAQAEVFMLDLRSQRDSDRATNGPDKSMLDGVGITNDQKTWLFDGLLNSDAKWKFVVSSSVWNPTAKKVDSWVCYPDEQQEIVDFVRANDIQGVVVLSGDMHSIGLIDDGTNSFFPELNVPPTDLDMDGCTGPGAICGTWSVPWVEDPIHAGYGLVEVRNDPSTGEDTVRLVVKDDSGSERWSLDVVHP